MTVAPPPSRSKDARTDSAPERDENRRQPNGAAAAALLAAGIGSMVLGVDVILTAAWEPIEKAFNLYAPGGSLTGQATFATVVWLGSWALLHAGFGEREVDLPSWLRATMILIGVGLLGTFPPFYGLFSH